MNQRHRKSTFPQLLRIGVSVLLALPSGGALTTERVDLGEPATAMDAPLDSLEKDDMGALAGYDDDPIERIYWETIDVLVPDMPNASSESAPGPFEGDPVAINDNALDAIRGGFEFADSNLKVSFGIERAVFVNGQLIASSVLNFQDLQWSSGAGQAIEQVPNGTTAVGLIQNGVGNTVAARLGADLAGTIIQNTLNDQNIKNITTINASLNSAQLMRSIAVHSAVHDAIVSSMPR